MRCNVGVDPIYLVDQHLIAEYRELPMVIGSLRINDWKIKTDVPKSFVLGKGHMNFFKNKLTYLSKRHNVVKQECINRGFNCHSLSIIINEGHPYCNDWSPDFIASKLIRKRIVEKLINRFEKSPTFWKYKSNTLTKELLYDLIECIEDSYLFYV